MLKCFDNHPPPTSDTPQQREQWKTLLDSTADAALVQMKAALDLDENETITQHTTITTGNTEAHKKTYSRDHCLKIHHFILLSGLFPKSKKRPRDFDTVDV
jgi:hypothetical protein